jgi:hypothetical protein
MKLDACSAGYLVKGGFKESRSGHAKEEGLMGHDERCGMVGDGSCK